MRILVPFTQMAQRATSQENLFSRGLYQRHQNSSLFSYAFNKFNAIKARLGSNEIQLDLLVQTMLKTYLEGPQEIESVIIGFINAATGQPLHIRSAPS